MAPEPAPVKVHAGACGSVFVEWAPDRAPSDLADAMKVGPIVLKYLREHASPPLVREGFAGSRSRGRRMRCHPARGRGSCCTARIANHASTQGTTPREDGGRSRGLSCGRDPPIAPGSFPGLEDTGSTCHSEWRGSRRTDPASCGAWPSGDATATPHGVAGSVVWAWARPRPTCTCRSRREARDSHRRRCMPYPWTC